MTSPRRLALLALVLAAACTSPGAQPCGDGFCPTGTVCAPDEQSCVVAEGACGDFPDGTACEGSDSHICVAGTCAASSCGDHYVDTRPAEDEQCDEGSELNSQLPDATCRDDCTPLRCGDSVRDTGETCDTGDLLSDVIEDRCRTSCVPAYCGDAVIDSTETPSCFGAPVMVDAGLTNFTMPELADLDGDGLLDVIFLKRLENGDGFVEVLFGRVDGGFDVLLLPDALGVLVSIGDVDGDGDADLALADGQLGTPVHFIVNQGARQFGAAPPFDAPALTGLALVDLDGDEIADLLAGDGLHLDVYRGGAAGQTLVDSIVLPFVVQGLLVGDASGDGLADAVLVGQQGVAVALADGAGGFSSLVVGGLAEGVRGRALADVDGDGDADLIAVSDEDSSTLVLLATGGGLLAAPTRIASVAPSLDFLAVGDLEPDGDLDAIRSDGTTTYQILRGDGSGALVAQALSTTTAAGFVALLDASHDGQLDLLSLGDGVHLHLGGDGPLGPFLRPWDGIDGLFAVGDVDGDLLDDVIIASDFAAYVVRSIGGLRFEAPVELGSTGQILDVELADLRGNGVLDVVMCGFDQLTVLRGDGAGDFALLQQIALPAAYSTFFIEIGDLDGDGDDDLVVVGAYAEGATDFLSYRSEQGQLGASGGLPSAADFDLTVHLADVDGDGRDDLVHSTAADVRAYLSAGDGDFAAQPTILATGRRVLTTGDFDGDGRTDVALVAQGELEILLARPGAPSEPVVGATTSDFEPNDAFAGDLDGDGVLDLVSTTDSIGLVFRGRGDGRFDPPYRFARSRGLGRSGDLNGDGRDDVVAFDLFDFALTLQISRIP